MSACLSLSFCGKYIYTINRKTSNKTFHTSFKISTRVTSSIVYVLHAVTPARVETIKVCCKDHAVILQILIPLHRLKIYFKTNFNTVKMHCLRLT